MKTTSGSFSVLESNGRHQFGELLVNKGMITQDELLGALDEQREKGGRIGEILIRRRILDDLTLSTVLAEHLCMEYIGLDDHSKIDLKVARALPESIAKRFCLLTLREEDGKLVTAMADPLDVVAIDTVMLKMQRPIKPVISAPGEIRRAIELIYHGSDIEERQLRDLVATENDADEEIAANIPAVEGFDGATGGEEAANQAPVIRFVDLLLRQAVKNRASDIHIEPQAETTIVRIRVDGVLREVVPPPRGCTQR
ncbi:MAG: hypothetical protein KBE65_09135 [Phycisphaerae bacterium]|nr:hypothetical protein [Phycisphaerae bacterium]